ncbi:MAG: energy-coupling factor ABC transporter ATP-binding protein [Desulfobacterales bacterium]|nr:energy-coupling factor ABC transporter ATP-binding protein [Desulfobacterales bacterium]
MPIYQLHHLVHYYGDKKVLDIPDLLLYPGSITGLMGPNGSGKSTLLKLLAFAVKPSEGSIRYKGKIEKPFSKSVRSRVTLLTQKPYLLKRSVFDNLAYGLKIRKDSRDLVPRIQKGLACVGLDFDTFARRQWHELSGGEAQRVAMAARLILEPEVLLLDEPVASVDQESAQRIRQAALDARDRFGTTLVIASHDANWLYECSDTQIHISKGCIQTMGEEIRIPWPVTNTTAPGSARIPRSQLHISPGPELDCDTHFSGTIQAMHHIQKTGAIMTTLELDLPSGPAPLTLDLDMELARRQQLHPGRTLILGFKSRNLQIH